MHVTEAVALLVSKVPPTLTIQTVADTDIGVLVFVHFMTHRTGNGEASRQRWQRAVTGVGNTRRTRSDIRVSTQISRPRYENIRWSTMARRPGC